MRTRREPVARVPLAAGDKVRFDNDRMPFYVRAVSPDGRWVICTRPFPLRNTVLYTIIDFDNGVRGPDDLVFTFGYENDEDIADNMQRLINGEMEVSVRHDTPLFISHVIRAEATP